MLKILRFGERFERDCALVLGGFDGLHLGHRALLQRAEETGLPVVATCMFGGKGKELFTREERRYLFAQAGAEAVCEIDFPAVRDLSAARFCEELFSSVKAAKAFCGEDFRFGRGAEGTPARLKELAPCPVFVQKTVKCLSDESGRMRKISTTLCKDHLVAGELSALGSCLCPRGAAFCGSAYFVQGTVEHGRQVGRTYGFPTLNLSVPQTKLLPPDGVYIGLCETPKGNFPAIVNFGARPTFGVEERKIEAYLDGFSGDLYGAAVRVYPLEFLRPIKKFSSAEALKEQLRQDLKSLRMYKKEGNV